VNPAEHDPQVAELVARLRSAFDPCTIWLLGSRALGRARQDSDFDVMVVVPESPESHFERLQRARCALRGFGHAVDVLVYTQSEWDYLAPKRYSVARQVRDRGTVLRAA
jgi:uncharacterized protein